MLPTLPQKFDGGSIGAEATSIYVEWNWLEHCGYSSNGHIISYT
jgi:hypothetical protein